jgi:hypothetical protein
MRRRGRTLPITCKPSSKIGAPTPVGKVRPVLTVVPGAAGEADAPRAEGSSLIDTIVRDGARRMLSAALQAEVEAYVGAFTDHVTRAVAGWWCATARISLVRC